MNSTNPYKQLAFETAYCKTHLTSRVNRHPITHEWPKRCARGGMLARNLSQGMPLRDGETIDCEIVVEGGENV